MPVIKRLSFISLLLFTFISVNAYAQPKADSEYIADLKKGELKLLKRTAKLIVRYQVKSPAVLDVATEILLQASPNINRYQVHTFTYLARAIGESLDGRYYNALKEVKKTSNSKHVRKWAKKAYKMIGGDKGKTQYKKGMVKLSTTQYY